MRRSLVTGGSGFVGRHLVAALEARGEAVRVLDLADHGDVETIRGSILDAAAARAAVDGVDCVFHLAGDAQLWSFDQGAFERVNHQGTRAMLAAASEAGVRRFIHCSSLTTLVGAKTPIGASAADEASQRESADMLGPYPLSKRRAEDAVEAAVRDGLDAVIAIPTEPLGAGDESLTPPTRMILDLLNGRTPATIDCTLNFVAAKSLAEGFVAVRDKGLRGERYLLGGDNVSMRQLLVALETLSGRKMPGVSLPYAVALIAGIVDTGLVARLTRKPPKAPLTGVRLAGRRVSFSSAKAERELGWRSAPFEAALREALDWFRARGLY